MVEIYRAVKIDAVFVFALLAAACGGESPQILMIDPKFTVIGENLTIMGENFGDEQGESFITIGGVTPTLSSYIEWSDTKIVARIPDFGESGLLYVHRHGKKSNPMMLSMLGSMPDIPEARANYAPVIAQVSPASASIGQFITIQGNGFGSTRNGSAVFFSWAAERQPSLPVEVSAPSFIEAGIYEAWGEHDIRVQVCDGAASGIVQVVTPHGRSNAAAFEVNEKTGVKTVKDKRAYSISYSVDVRINEAAPPNTMYLWCPLPASTSSQLNRETISEDAKPFVEDYRGSALYRLTDLKDGDSKRISISCRVDVYGVDTRIQPEQVRPYGDSSAGKAWTRPSRLVPSDDPEVAKMAAAFAGGERNPYLKARSIYRNFLKEFTITGDRTYNSVRQAIDEKEADPYTAAMLFCALYRAAGIPAMPLAGILCARIGGAVPHYWVEFWLDDFGWVPVDPALGAGFTVESFKLRSDHETYYFGNMDNQHLVFSRGEAALSQMDIRGRVTGRERNYSLQNIWEEVSGGIEAYSSHWSDVNVTGVYSN
jgi:hypothetical protein